ncbi:hypothetical protein DITRI_Ditri02bG0147300 [Diplodiscus trichospermus]
MFLSSIAMAETKLSLKLLIDKKANKVLFAEAGKEFVDFLFYLLSLPVGTIINLLKSETMVGCIGNLYESLENLNEAYLQPNQHKNLLLKPDMPNVVIGVPLLLPDTSQDPAQRKYYNCSYYRCSNGSRYVTNNPNTLCPSCGNSMSTEVSFVGMNPGKAGSTSEGGVVKGLATYMVMDDLTITPMSMISGIALLNKCNIKDFSALEERMVEFSINEGPEMLRASLQSKTALTYVFILKEFKEV